MPSVTPAPLPKPSPSTGSLAPTFHAFEVIDGDTLRLASGGKVRLIGVNAPERKEPLGPMATQCLRDILGGQRVRLEVGVETVGQD